MASNKCALVLSGGMGLGAYHGGVYEAALEAGQHVHWLAGASIGAVTAVLIAGSTDPIASLRRFWKLSDPITSVASGQPFEKAMSWSGALRSRFFGVAGQFHPRVGLSGDHPSPL